METIKNYGNEKIHHLNPEGETLSPNGNEVENLQVLGIVEAVKDENEAIVKLLQENEWIIDAEFNVAEFICYEIV
ncbi:hypothetical protein H9X57_15460 [Flavobacterium piscinae]|uniref:hypothetical protein n=1 Tax=Flavobacterium piscinae TaxID=2506424 RepID=UPI0019CE5EC4|nr:hypothetical protein [Flavobacterium piscinae]MBC8884270.1 hypothetical protein [Flavobacterium piscinae]